MQRGVDADGGRGRRRSAKGDVALNGAAEVHDLIVARCGEREDGSRRGIGWHAARDEIGDGRQRDGEARVSALSQRGEVRGSHTGSERAGRCHELRGVEEEPSADRAFPISSASNRTAATMRTALACFAAPSSARCTSGSIGRPVARAESSTAPSAATVAESSRRSSRGS